MRLLRGLLGLGALLALLLAGLAAGVGFGAEWLFHERLGRMQLFPGLRLEPRYFERGWWSSAAELRVVPEEALAERLQPYTLRLRIHHGPLPLSAGGRRAWRPLLALMEGEWPADSPWAQRLALQAGGQPPLLSRIHLDGSSEHRLQLPAASITQDDRQLIFSGADGLLDLDRQGQPRAGFLLLGRLQWVDPAQGMLALEDLELNLDESSRRLQGRVQALRLNTSDGQLEGAVEFRLAPLTSVPPLTLSALGRWVEHAQAELAISRGWLRMLMRRRLVTELRANAETQGRRPELQQLERLADERVEQQLAQYQAAGFLRQDGDRYRTRLRFEGGRLLFNGKTMPLPLL
ncbi:MAG TPA: DUF945 family protein [Candidatus Competibacteraceae bacterium]|nr:DUF945 family protein [Candidatus Competibacteraceae bacterium]